MSRMVVHVDENLSGARQSSQRVVVVGSVNADLVVHVDRHPVPGETVLGGDARHHPGGKGANQAVAAARLGAEVSFAGRVGTDAAGDMLTTALRDAGADLTTLGIDQTAPSGVALIVVDSTGENTIVVSPGANHRVGTADVDAAFDALTRAGVVVLQCELPAPTVTHAAHTAVARGARVVLNLAPPMRLGPDVLALADPLVVNVHEAAYLLGAEPEEDAVELLRALGPASAVVTRGERGATAGDSRGVSSCPAPRAEVVDATGAGDAFTGALAARLAAGEDVHAATRFAVRAGAAAVRAAGAQSSFPTAEELEEGPRGR